MLLRGLTCDAGEQQQHANHHARHQGHVQTALPLQQAACLGQAAIVGRRRHAQQVAHQGVDIHALQPRHAVALAEPGPRRRQERVHAG